MKPQTVDGLPEHDDNAVLRVAGEFLRDVPKEAEAEGRWPAPSTHALLTRTFPVRDGLYRAGATDWLFRFRGGKLVEAIRVAPPDYGGAEVITLNMSPISLNPTVAA